MAELIAGVGPCGLRRRRDDDHFSSLVRAIVYQQLAGTAAAAIHARVTALTGGRFTAEAVSALSLDTLRGAGLSGAKAASVLDLAAKVVGGEVVLEGIERRPDEEIRARLTSVRGIGPWTVDMFLIFRLRRLDVWPVGDYGVRKGYALAYGLSELPSPTELTALGERFRPQRSVAAWYLWRAADQRPPG